MQTSIMKILFIKIYLQRGLRNVITETPGLYVEIQRDFVFRMCVSRYYSRKSFDIFVIWYTFLYVTQN